MIAYLNCKIAHVQERVYPILMVYKKKSSVNNNL